MADRNAGHAGQFKKGPDPRRNLNGQVSKKVLAFNKTLRDLIITEGNRKQTDRESKVTMKKVEWMIKILWNEALKGEHWAVEFIAERTEGKITQPISGEITHALHFKFGENGNDAE